MVMSCKDIFILLIQSAKFADFLMSQAGNTANVCLFIYLLFIFYRRHFQAFCLKSKMEIITFVMSLCPSNQSECVTLNVIRGERHTLVKYQPIRELDSKGPGKFHLV